MRHPLPQFLSSVSRCYAVSPPSGSQNSCPCCHHPPGALEGSGSGCAALLFPLRTAEARPWPRSERDGSCSSSSSRGCSASAIAQPSRPCHLLPTRARWCHARCRCCHPCPAPDDTGKPGDSASGKNRRGFSCRANLELRFASGRAEHVEKLLSKVFPPGCVAGGACGGAVTCLSLLLPCLSQRGAGTWGQHPLPTRAVLCSCPVPWNPSRDGDAPAHPKFTAWATGAPRHPSSEPLSPSGPD